MLYWLFLLGHGPATARRLGVRQIACLDLLELLAFAMPARAAAPTLVGLAMALGLDTPSGGMVGRDGLAAY